MISRATSSTALPVTFDPHVLCRSARHYATEGLSGFIGKRNDLSVLNDYGGDVPMPYTTSMIC